MKKNMNDELARIKSEPALSQELFRRREYSIHHLEYDKELGRGYVRIAYGFPEIQLMPALEELAAAVKARRK